MLTQSREDAIIRVILVLTSLGLLASCGADGMPMTPAATTPAVAAPAEVTIGGSMSAGVAKNGSGY